MDRLAQLMKLAAAQPEDPLAHYGVGLELMKLARWEEADAAFHRVLAIDPQYSAAHYQMARAYLKLGRRDAAREALSAGMRAARANGEAHTENAMREMLETLS